MTGKEAGKTTGCGSRCLTVCGWDDRQKAIELAPSYGTKESECWPHPPSVKGAQRIPCGWSGGAVRTETSMEMHRAGLRTREKRGELLTWRWLRIWRTRKASPDAANRKLCEQLMALNYLIDVANGRTASKKQERQFVSIGGKLSVVKTGSQVLADAIIEERTHQYTRRHGCFWTAYVTVKMGDRKKSTRISSSSRHGASKGVIYASMLSGQNLHALSVNLRFPNRGKLRRQSLWVLI